MYLNLTELLDALIAPVTNTAHPASARPVLGGVPAAGARTGTGMLPAEVRP
jgi:hypothetical protein